jgi:hypothetical protein
VNSDLFIEAEEVAGQSTKRCYELFEVSPCHGYQCKKQMASPRVVGWAITRAPT